MIRLPQNSLTKELLIPRSSLVGEERNSHKGIVCNPLCQGEYVLYPVMIVLKQPRCVFRCSKGKYIEKLTCIFIYRHDESR